MLHGSSPFRTNFDLSPPLPLNFDLMLLMRERAPLRIRAAEKPARASGVVHVPRI